MAAGRDFRWPILGQGGLFQKKALPFSSGTKGLREIRAIFVSIETLPSSPRTDKGIYGDTLREKIQ